MMRKIAAALALTWGVISQQAVAKSDYAIYLDCRFTRMSPLANWFPSSEVVHYKIDLKRKSWEHFDDSQGIYLDNVCGGADKAAKIEQVCKFFSNTIEYTNSRFISKKGYEDVLFERIVIKRKTGFIMAFARDILKINKWDENGGLHGPHNDDPMAESQGQCQKGFDLEIHKNKL